MEQIFLKLKKIIQIKIKKKEVKIIKQFSHQFPSESKLSYFVPYVVAVMLSQIPKCMILCHVVRDPLSKQ